MTIEYNGVFVLVGNDSIVVTLGITEWYRYLDVEQNNQLLAQSWL